MFPGPTELRLIGCSIESTWTQKSKSSTIDTKNQLADILTKVNCTRDEWNHLLCLFNISHFSSTVCSEVMSKRTQKDSGEERVTAKSRPMMSLIARAPSNLSSSTSESLGKRSYGNEDPWSAKAERERIDWSNPLWAATQKPRLTLIMNKLLKALSQHATQSGMITKLGLLKSGKLTLRCVTDRGNPFALIRSQQDPGRKRVTPKSQPMMNLIARTPSDVSSSTSVSLGKRSYGSQDPWSSIAKEDRSERPVKSTDLIEASDHHYHEQVMEKLLFSKLFKMG